MKKKDVKISESLIKITECRMYDLDIQIFISKVLNG